MNYVEIEVTCKTCGQQKQPHGRSASMHRSYCDNDCVGYNDGPKPGCLWPGETSEDFGYKHCLHATKQAGENSEKDGITEQDIAETNWPKYPDFR